MTDNNQDSTHGTSWDTITWSHVANNTHGLVNLYLPYMPRAEEVSTIENPLSDALGPYILVTEDRGFMEVPVKDGWVNVTRGITAPYAILRALAPSDSGDAPYTEFILDEDSAGIVTSMAQLIAVLDPSVIGVEGTKSSGSLLAANGEYPHQQYNTTAIFIEGTVAQFTYPHGGALDPLATGTGMASIADMTKSIMLEDAQEQGQSLSPAEAQGKAIALIQHLFEKHTPVVKGAP